MYGRRGRTSAACAVLVAALGSTACAAESSAGHATPSPVATSSSAADAEALQAAEATVRGFFAVRSHAQDELSVRLDAQAAYLTARDVHPAAEYEASWRGRPNGITDTDLHVDLSDARWVGDDIQIDFELTATSISYPVEGTELQLDAGAPGESYWNGTATLEDRDGEWLIDDLATDSAGGSMG